MPIIESANHIRCMILLGQVCQALEFYSSALDAVSNETSRITAPEQNELSAVLFSNRAMCYLKQYDNLAIQDPSNRDVSVNQQSILNGCIQDCTEGLRLVESQSVSSPSLVTTKSKLFYRRAKAYYHLTTAEDTQTRHCEDVQTNLNLAANDLLTLLSFDEGNAEAAQLLRTVKQKHGMMGGSRSKVARALDYLQGTTTSKEISTTPLDCLRMLQASLVDDAVTSSEEIGRNGGVSLLLSIARHGIQDPSSQMDATERVHCRIASLHILSACCSHDSFIIKYASRDCLPPATLAQIVEEEEHRLGGSNDTAIASMALLIRLIVHWDHREVMRFFASKIEEDGTVAKDEGAAFPYVPEVDASSVCRVAIAALTWGSKHDTDAHASVSNATPRAALDLLSAWTASDLDALDAASDACFDSSPSIASSNNQFKKATHTKITSEEMRAMKPRQVAAHRKREAEYRTLNLQRAVQHISIFCNQETGGLDAMLALCARTKGHRLRREVGLQIGRMMAVLEEQDDVKKLVAGALGCRDWRVGNDNKEKDGGLERLTIEELDEEKEEEGSCDEKENDPGGGISCDHETRAADASLLIGKPEVGTWALKHGWSNGSGVEDLKRLISSNDSRAMSIASELVSEAASVESARPLLSRLVEEGTLDVLLVHPDADVRSGAASCAAKIGLASKAFSEDEGEVMELLDVAIELLFDEVGIETVNTNNISSKKNTLSKVPQTTASTQTTSMDRGIEVITYLASKTFVKNKIANGYKPKGSPPYRNTAIQRLVEIASAPNSGDAQMAYGLAGIFNLLSVSTETLQKEAFVGKEITKEQYDQLQALGKTEEEKEIEAKKDEKESDFPQAVTQRIQKLANASVPRAIVKLLEGSKSDSTQQKLLEGMGRMASEHSMRGTMIQQGCLSACLQLDNGTNRMKQRRRSFDRMLVTTNPSILNVSQRSGSIGPLIKLVKDNDALDLMHFEALLSLTNLASFGDETKNRIIASSGIPVISYAMLSDHEMVRQAATEALCNVVPHPQMMEYLRKEDNLKIWVAFASDYEENFGCARAAVGCLAMAIPDPDLANALIRISNFGDMIRSLMECGQVELMHRVLVLISGLIEHGGACRDAVVATGAGAFCEAYVASYHDGHKMQEFSFSPAEQGTFYATLSLAKEIVKMLR